MNGWIKITMECVQKKRTGSWPSILRHTQFRDVRSILLNSIQNSDHIFFGFVSIGSPSTSSMSRNLGYFLLPSYTETYIEHRASSLSRRNTNESSSNKRSIANAKSPLDFHLFCLPVLIGMQEKQEKTQ